ncbi:MAG: hypothetical protein M1829_000481 [Trizodia sp. TS-e1964]|nr:MAG: hypothetical protein M1829_000481 [Trizodia sp. TS-e1964]
MRMKGGPRTMAGPASNEDGSPANLTGQPWSPEEKGLFWYLRFRHLTANRDDPKAGLTPGNEVLTLREIAAYMRNPDIGGWRQYTRRMLVEERKQMMSAWDTSYSEWVLRVRAIRGEEKARERERRRWEMRRGAQRRPVELTLWSKRIHFAMSRDRPLGLSDDDGPLEWQGSANGSSPVSPSKK